MLGFEKKKISLFFEIVFQLLLGTRVCVKGQPDSKKLFSENQKNCASLGSSQMTKSIN